MTEAIDWAALKAGFEAGRSLRALGAEGGLSPARIGRRARRDGWRRPRSAAGRKNENLKGGTGKVSSKSAKSSVPARGGGAPRQPRPKDGPDFLRRIEKLVDGYLGRIEQRFDDGDGSPDADTRDLAAVARILEKLTDLNLRERSRLATQSSSSDGDQEPAGGELDDWSELDTPAFFDRLSRHLEDAVGRFGVGRAAEKPVPEGAPPVDDGMGSGGP